MPFNPTTGVYTAPDNSWNPAVAGTVIDPDDWNATQEDYVDAINTLSTTFNVKEFGAVGDNVTDDTAAVQRAIDAAVAAGYGTVYFPGRGPYKINGTLDVSSNSYTRLAIVGDPAQAQINCGAVTGVVLFDGKASSFKTNALEFRNLYINISSGSSAPGNLAFDIENRQETVWDNVTIYGYREGIRLTTSWAPIIRNKCLFQDVLGKAVYASDSSFKGARISGNAFFGNGISLSQPCLNVGPGSGVSITENDFSTNYNPIQLNNVGGVQITGNYFEDSTLGSIEFVNTTGNSDSVLIAGNDLEAGGATTFQYVDGLTFINNRMFNWAVTYGATATRVLQYGNTLTGTASLGSPTYATSTTPMIASTQVSAFRFALAGGSQDVLYNDTGGGGDHTAIRSRELSANGRISVGGTTDPTTYYDQTLHLFRSATGGTVFGSWNSSSLSASTSVTVTSTSANALAVGRQGSTDPVLQVNANTASVATGISITGAPPAGGVALAAISSGTNENLAIDAKGSGTITLGGTSTGAITLTRAVTASSTISASGTVTSTASPGFTISGAAGTARRNAFQTSGSNRFQMGLTGDAESGGNAGSNFVWQTYDDSGVFIANAFTMTRSSGAISWIGDETILSATAIPAGGAAGAGYKFSSTANFGVFFGSGAPTLSAAKGSLYLRSDGSTTNDRAYINTNGSTTWTALTTAA
jgi:hypothetical protein